MKVGLYEAFHRKETKLWTLTYRDSFVLAGEPSPKRLLDEWNRYSRLTGSSGMLLAERSKAGRLHLHGLADTSSEFLNHAANLDAELWKHRVGRITLDPVTDLMGAIAYLCKAFGPDTEYSWRVKDGVADDYRRIRSEKSREEQGRAWLRPEVSSEVRYEADGTPVRAEVQSTFAADPFRASWEALNGRKPAESKHEVPDSRRKP